jgi:hypothetical protein
MKDNGELFGEDVEDIFAAMDELENKENSSLEDFSNKEKTSEKNDELNEEIEDFVNDDGEQEETDDNTSSLEGNSSPTIALSLALALRDKGVMTSIDEETVKGVKEIDEVLDLLVKDRDNSMKLDMTESQKKYFEALKEGIPDAEIRQDLSAEEAYNSLTDADLEENDTLQQNVYLNDLLSQGLSEEKAKKIVANAVSTGTLLEDSKESLSSLQAKSKVILSDKITKAKEAQAAQITANKEKVSKLKDDILKAEELAGYKLTETLKDKIFETLTKVVEVDNKVPLNAIASERKKNPVEFEKRMALFFHLTDGFKDASVLVKKAQTDGVKTLKAQLEKNGLKEGVAHKAPISTSTQSLLKSLKEETIK